MKIKFTRSVLVYSEHRELGSIHEIKDSDALGLIADGAAVKITNPQNVETADIKPTVKETASLKRK